MVHRMTIRSNPRLLVVPLVMAGLIGIALAAFSGGPLLGIGALAVAGYVSYVLFRFVRKQLRCAVEVGEEGFELDLYGEEKVRVEWSQVSHRGTARDTRGRRLLFLYREDEDKLLVVPDEFEGFDSLVGEVAKHGPMMELELQGAETVKDRLRSLLGDASADAGEPEATPPPS